MFRVLPKKAFISGRHPLLGERLWTTGPRDWQAIGWPWVWSG